MTCNSSMFGWKILFIKPILGDLKGYWSGSSTWIFHTPPANGAMYDMKGCSLAERSNRYIAYFLVDHKSEHRTLACYHWRDWPRNRTWAWRIAVISKTWSWTWWENTHLHDIGFDTSPCRSVSTSPQDRVSTFWKRSGHANTHHIADILKLSMVMRKCNRKHWRKQ